MDPYDSTQEVHYHLYERYRTTGSYFYSPKLNAVMERATRDVRNYHYQAARDNFNATTVLVVTWDKVTPYTWYSGSCAPGDSCANDRERNTFQVIYATDGSKAYAVTIYRQGAMSWRYVANRIIVIGYAHERTYNDLGVTNTRLTVDMDKHPGTAGRPGVFIDRVGETDSSSQRCCRFHQQNEAYANSPVFRGDMRKLFQCPCTRSRLGTQWWFVERRGTYRNIECYAISPVHMRLRFPRNKLNKLCCYISLNYYWPPWNSWWSAPYLSGTPESGHILTRDPFLDPRGSYEEDIRPKSWCCRDSSASQCDLFNAVRPDMGCSPFAEFVTGSSWGDPHITTLDNKQYTMNGWGEYILIEGNNFVLQGRTDRVSSANGTLLNATVFVAFAARDSDRAKVQVELSITKTSMVIFGDSVDITNEFYLSDTFRKAFENFTVQREEINNRTTCVVSFVSGISLKMFVGMRNLELSVDATDEFRGEIKGLLGNFNRNISDDFILPNGTILPPSQTDREIFENFGQKWEVSATNSIFSYGPLEGPDSFSHPEFVPVFLDEVANSSKAAAYSLCGTADVACIFDFIATDDMSFAANTKMTGEVSRETRSALENNLPTINITEGLNNESLWEVVSGQSAQLAAELADDDNDPLVCQLINGSHGVQVSENGTITYFPDSEMPVTIAVQAVDFKNGTSSILTISVAVCPNCSGHGQCNKNIVQDIKSTTNFVVFSCNCSSAYTGPNCDQNYDACNDNPCAKGQTCTDLTPQEQGSSTVGFRCGPCPTGFEKRNITVQEAVCTDINECNTTNMCAQDCTNTEGSYICSCKNGYRLDADLRTCKDIDECAEKSHNCPQDCVNTAGGFQCKCFIGTSENCTLDAASQEICKGSNCSDLCNVVSGRAVCLCSSGYTLKADLKTCENINECNDPRKFCSQICTDTMGSFNCSCLPGYSLATDRTSCQVCEPSFWGMNCANRCQCSGHGTCNPARGCICDSGWEGVNCNDDVDECDLRLDNCSSSEVCVNAQPGYVCQCLSGYQRVNGACTDIDECLDISSNNCNTTIETCQNNVGNYNCLCKAGYSRNTTTRLCEDINECATGTHRCQQKCVNSLGSYFCQCHDGYKLVENRLDCIQDKDLCDGPTRLNCSQGCTIDINTNVSLCFCYSGYQLNNDNITCSDINECQVYNLCSNECVNHSPGYNCTCPVGKLLDNDGRTCIDCPQGTWGYNCNMSCACSTGSYNCSLIQGCLCNPGYNGTHCERNVNQCPDLSCSPDANQTCVDRPGPDFCECKSGYNNTSGQCTDIDECALQIDVCAQDCNNTNGNYTCSCILGFKQGDQYGTCNDIDECAENNAKCQHNCTNTYGDFKCSCMSGFRLLSDGVSCEEEMIRNISIRINYNVTFSLTDINSNPYNELRVYLEILISRILKEKMSDLYSVQIISMNPGSLIVKLELLAKKIEEKEYVIAIVDALKYLSNHADLKINGTKVNITHITIDNEEVPIDSPLCHIYQALVIEDKNCDDQSRGKSSDEKLILGLAIGLSLFVVVTSCVMAAVIIWKRRRATSFENSVNEEYSSNIFGKSLVKYGSWGKPENQRFAYDNLTWSTDSSGDGKNNQTDSKKPTESPNTGEKHKGNFSWDFVYKTLDLEPGEDFKIQRPKITLGYQTKL